MWKRAHRLLPTLLSTRYELREALSHLGWTVAESDVDTILDVRRACGPHWFDYHYSTKGLKTHGRFSTYPQ